MPGRQPAGSGHSKTVAGLVLFAGIMACVPLLLHKRQMRLQSGSTMIASEKPLNPTAVHNLHRTASGAAHCAPLLAGAARPVPEQWIGRRRTRPELCARYCHVAPHTCATIFFIPRSRAGDMKKGTYKGTAPSIADASR
jgi:hypothetical protein